jgi:hypothetical protein
MNWILSMPVIALAVLQGPAVAQPLDPRTEADAYSVYASLNFKPGVILMQETEGPQYRACSDFISGLSGEWRQVAQDFRDKNSRTWLLQPGAQGFEYRLISKAEIVADNARMSKQYGGRPPQLAPERIQYVALSAVGFNATRTKALVHVERRGGFNLLQLIRSGNRWVRDPKVKGECGGIV